MSIRAKILAGCLALTLLTGLLGLYAHRAEQRLGTLGLDIYDKAFMSVSYLRAAQLEFAPHDRRPDRLPDDAKADLLDNLRVVQQRAMSPRGAAETATLRRLAAAALHSPDPAAFAAATTQFERVVEIFAGDGFRYRREVGRLVRQEQRTTLLAVAATLLAALAATALIGQLIAPPVRRAVAIAQAIAANRLDNAIAQHGRGETGDLLRALATMQASIGANLARIRGLMDEQAQHHAGEIAMRNAQMEAALGNMNQGLCLFGADGCLLVANRRFGDMFGMPPLGHPAQAVFRSAGLEALIDAARCGEVAALSHSLPDGRIIALSQQPVAGGGWVATFEDVSAQRRAEAELAHMARHDGLTGLPNRLLLTEHLAGLRQRAPTESIAVLCVDLDRFKAVNDTFGPPAGDAVLCLAADRLRACANDTDLVVRLGSDEFAIVRVGEGAPAGPAALAERIIAAMAVPFDIAGQPVSIGASLGIALSDPAAAAPPLGTLLKSADLALSRAKSERPGGYTFFEAEMDIRLQARRKLEQDLRGAIDYDQLEVFYQPLVKVGCGISGFEALMRWRHPERGLVPPDVFIPVAEEIGLIGAMGAWVMRQACTDAAGWPGALTVAVNLSPLQFRGRQLEHDVAQVLRASRLPPARLQLEITEGVLLQEDAPVLATLHAIRELGVRIAMDDFGTGYSSLGYLRRFPFDKIKIDQSFVRNMIDRNDCLSIVRAVIGLGRSLGMEVNAEGVETEVQMRALINEGCGELQGYLFSRPRPASDVPAMIQHLRHAAGPATRETPIPASHPELANV